MDSSKHAITFCFDIYHRYDKTGRIEIINGKLIKNEVYTQNLLFHLCPRAKTFPAVVSALEDRVFCESRFDDIMKKSLKLEHYNIYDILRKTHGVDIDDFIWLKFDGENITWDDVKVR